jgi:hypothetical protein
MSDSDIRRFVPALRRAWAAMQAVAFGSMGRWVISGAELRAYLGGSLAIRDERNRSVRAWNRLSPEARAGALRAAFPDGPYPRTEPPNGGGN